MGIDPTNEEIARIIRIKANKLVGRYGFRRCDVEDIQQVLVVMLLENGQKLVAHTAAQMTVLDRALNNAIRKMIEKRRAKKRDSRRDIHIDDAPEDAFVDPRDPIEELILQLDVDDTIESLPEALQQLAQALRHSKPPEAARELGFSRSKLRHQIRMITRHFEDRELGDASGQSGADSGQ